MFSVEFYRKEDGSAPVEEFLAGLPIKHRVKALDGLAVLEEFGSSLREPYSKSIGDGLFELRVKFSSDIIRVFYFLFCGKTDHYNQWICEENFQNPCRRNQKSAAVPG